MCYFYVIIYVICFHDKSSIFVCFIVHFYRLLFFIFIVYFYRTFLLFVDFSYLCSNISLLEVGLHVSLEIEIGKLSVLLDLKKLVKLDVGMDDATIILILQFVSTDVSGEQTAHLSARHLSTASLSEESGKLVADNSRLDKSRWLAVDIAALLLAGSLGGSLHLLCNCLLESLEVLLHGGEETHQLLKVGTELGHLENNGRSLGLLSSSRGSNNLIDGSRGRGGCLGGLSGLGCLGGRCSRGLFGGLGCFNHSRYYILL